MERRTRDEGAERLKTVPYTPHAADGERECGAMRASHPTAKANTTQYSNPTATAQRGGAR